MAATHWLHLRNEKGVNYIGKGRMLHPDLVRVSSIFFCFVMMSCLGDSRYG